MAWTESAVLKEQKQGKHALGGGLYLRVQGTLEKLRVPLAET